MASSQLRICPETDDSVSTCACVFCTARRAGAHWGLDAFRQIVDLAAQLKQENGLGRQLYEQADNDRRALLQVLGPLATEYHRLGGTISDAGHTQPIASCQHNVCATVREGMLAIGQNRAAAGDDSRGGQKGSSDG